MFTIKQAARRVGVSEEVLRAWERRYGVVTPERTDSGYRLYDDAAIAVLSTMRALVEEGWSPAAAARHVGAARPVAPAREPQHTSAVPLPQDEAAALTDELLEAASAVDPAACEGVLDRAFALGSFENVVQTWLMPALTTLGEAWAAGDVDVAGEHAAAHVVMRRLSQSFTAAASTSRGTRLVVALPPGSLHELGALAFATVARRRGLPVVYLGADLPVGSWVRAVRAFPTRAAVVVVPTEADRPAAQAAVAALQEAAPGLTVAVGGGASVDLAPGVLPLPQDMATAAHRLEALTA